MTGRGGFGLEPLVGSAVAAVLGAAVAALWRFGDRDWWTVVVPVGAALAGVLVSLAVMRTTPAASPQQRHRAGASGDSWRVDRSARSPDQPARPQVTEPHTAAGNKGVAETVRLVLPLDEPAPAPGWWNRSDAVLPITAAPAERPRAPSPDLASYRGSARVVQCPRCGAFRVDATHTGDGFTFRCRVDEHSWTWQPGTPWPATVVASRRRNSH